MSSGPRLPPGARPPLPPQFWLAAARIAAGAAIVTLGVHRNAAFVAAGLLAAGTATAAWTEARFRARHGRPTSVADVLAAGLALACVLMYLLALAASIRR